MNESRSSGDRCIAYLGRTTRHIRRHLTYANVMATIAVFLVLGGGTAFAAYVVTSNSQIGPGTVSGHTPPTGKHPNIIAGSVNGGDVADNSLRGGDIIEQTLTGNAQKLIFNSDDNIYTPTKIAIVGPYTVKVTCQSSSYAIYLDLYVNGPAGTYQRLFTEFEEQVPDGPPRQNVASEGGRISANRNQLIYELLAGQGYFDNPTVDRGAGTVMLRSGSTLVQLDLDVGADATGKAPWPKVCMVYGTGTSAT
jgi:hypothetical protein